MTSLFLFVCVCALLSQLILPEKTSSKCDVIGRASSTLLVAFDWPERGGRTTTQATENQLAFVWPVCMYVFVWDRTLPIKIYKSCGEDGC